MPRPASASFARVALAAAWLIATTATVARAESAAAESTEFASGVSAGLGSPAPGVTSSRHSPSTALLVGLASTAGPIAIGFAQRDEYYTDQPNFATASLGLLVGVTLGPAIGLATGGRGDLAYRGLLLRGAALGLSTGALLAASTGNEGGTVGAFIAGASLAGISAVHDLIITPSAVAEGRPRARAALAVRPDGALAVQVKF